VTATAAESASTAYVACEPPPVVPVSSTSVPSTTRSEHRTTLLADGYMLEMPTHRKFACQASIEKQRAGFFDCTMTAFTTIDKMRLSLGAVRIRDTPNAGGTSVNSEVMSFEFMRLLFGCTLLKTEMEIEYCPRGKITDYAMMMNRRHYGVSVTRALKFRGVFTRADANKLLTKKLFGIVESSRNVVHKFDKQILHILVYEPYVADVLRAEWETLSAELTSNTTVLVTYTKNAPWIYYPHQT